MLGYKKNIIANENLIVGIDNSIKYVVFCNICSGLIRKPRLACKECWKYACEQCIQAWQIKNKGTFCPFESRCANPTYVIDKNYSLMAILQEIKILCPNSLNQFMHEQCDDLENYDNYEEHYANCQFTYQNCKTCNKQIIKKYLTDHSIECKNNKLTMCNKCNCHIPAKFLENHQLANCDKKDIISFSQLRIQKKEMEFTDFLSRQMKHKLRNFQNNVQQHWQKLKKQNKLKIYLEVQLFIIIAYLIFYFLFNMARSLILFTTMLITFQIKGGIILGIIYLEYKVFLKRLFEQKQLTIAKQMFYCGVFLTSTSIISYLGFVILF